jgi:hypothetical protein
MPFVLLSFDDGAQNQIERRHSNIAKKSPDEKIAEYCVCDEIVNAFTIDYRSCGLFQAANVSDNCDITGKY